MRICAISLPELRIEVVRANREVHEPTRVAWGPLAIVVAPPPLTEAKLLGNTRLDVVSAEARKFGVKPGQTIAQARARIGELSVRVVRPEAVRDVLARLAETALAFGATVAFDPATGPDGDIVWVDVTGCAHLHAPGPQGEVLLASRLATLVEGLGHTCAVAIADGPRVAAMLARQAAQRAQRALTDRTVVIAPGHNAEAIAHLPVSMLPLAPEDVRWLVKIGVRTIAELRALPRSALGARLGARAGAVLTLADGEDRAPLALYVPPEVPTEETALEYGIETTSALTFVAKTLTDRLAARLAGRAVATSRLELELALDAAMLEGGEAREVIVAELPAPLSAAGDLLSVLRPKIEATVLRAPVSAVKLRAKGLVSKPQAALSLFDPSPRAERVLPRLVAELAADLGTDAVGKLVLGDSWLPEERSRFVRWQDAKPEETRRRRHLLSTVPEPTRDLAAPCPIAQKDIRVIRHLARLDAVQWWRSTGSSALDYVQAWTDDGMAWVTIDRQHHTAHLRGWFD